MGRGLFSGVLWGSVIAAMSLVLLSQISGIVGLVSEPPRDVAVVAPDVVEPVVNAKASETPVAPDSQGGPATDPSRQGTGLNASDADSAFSTDTTPANVPVASDVTGGQSSPEQGTAPVVQVRDETPAMPDTVATAPVAPGGETAPVPVAKLPAPLVPSETAVALESPALAEETIAAVLAPDTSPTAGAEPDQPPSPVTDTVPENDFSTPTVIATPKPVEPEPEPAPDADVVVPDGNAGEAPAEPGNAVVVNRGSAATENTAVAPDVVAEGADPEADAEGAPADGPAIEIYAEVFDNPEGRPLMAILLLPPTGGDAVPIPTAALPFPVNYAVDASKDNATTLMRAFRDAGSEVAVLTPLPEGAAPKDVEVAFGAYFAAVPEAVAVIDVRDAVFQSGRDVATQVAEALAASGLGMVTYSRGLNAATQVAERAGVPAALVFRVFDDNNRDAAAIKRFLDQAAFRAGQQTGVILVGHNRPDTRAALLEWALGNRAGTVALAPLSAVLLGQ